MMKYITRTVAKNFKGRDFDFLLGQVTVLTGDNGAGKTAATDSIRIGLIGYSPRHGKQAAKTFGFCGSPKGASWMSVAQEFSDKTNIARRWEMKRGSIKADNDAGEIVPPVLLDANEWLKKSGPEKVRFVFNLIDLPKLGFTTEKVTARLKADIKVETPSEASEKILAQIIKTVEDLAGRRDVENQTYQFWIESVIDTIKELDSAAKAVATDMEGAIGASTQLRAQEGLQQNQSVAGELEAARKKLLDATTEFQGLSRQSSEYANRLARRSRINEDMVKFTDQTDIIVQLEAEHAAQIRSLQGYQSQTPELIARLTKAQIQDKATSKAITEFNQEIADLKTELENDLQKDRCPYCKSKGKGWKDALTESVNEEIAEVQKKLDAMIVSQKGAQDELAEVQPFVEASKKRDDEIGELRAKNFALGRQINTAKESQAEFTTLKARLGELADIGNPVDPERIANAQSDVDDAKEKVQELEQQEREQIGAIQDQRRAEQARQAHADKLIEIEVYKIALKVMATLQSEMMEAAFAGFMEKMNVIADGILPGKLVFHEGEIGYWAGASFASLAYFGGTEELLTFAGLSLTLAQDAKVKIIIMDELGRVIGYKKEKLISRMIELVRQGVIDQFIGIDVDPNTYRQFIGQPEFALIEIK